MKWNEIPKFKEFGTLTPVNMGFLNYLEFVKKEVQENNLQMVPDFQRGHVWTEEQQIAYVEFFLRGGKSGRDFYFNWNEDTNEYICVDGLQRTTALDRFVKEEIQVFGQYFEDFGFSKREAGGQPFPEYTVNIFQNHLGRKDVLEWYIKMNSGGTPHTRGEIEKVKQMILDVE